MTFSQAVKDENINVFHPGNYVFLDTIQMSVNRATEEDCALTVYATIISHPREDLFICDAGAKCLGLDQGAHGKIPWTRSRGSWKYFNSWFWLSVWTP